MSDAVSPYALLSASKPKQTPSVVTPYDLYSMAQDRSGEPPPPANIMTQETPTNIPAHSPAIRHSAAFQTRKTHYVSDINIRHQLATSRAAMQSAPLPPL